MLDKILTRLGISFGREGYKFRWNGYDQDFEFAEDESEDYTHISVWWGIFTNKSFCPLIPRKIYTRNEWILLCRKY